MTKYERDPETDPIVATLRFEKKDYELTKSGKVYVLYANGNYQTAGRILDKTPCKRVLHRDSPRRRAIIAAFETDGKWRKEYYASRRIYT